MYDNVTSIMWPYRGLKFWECASECSESKVNVKIIIWRPQDCTIRKVKNDTLYSPEKVRLDFSESELQQRNQNLSYRGKIWSRETKFSSS